MTKGDLVFMGPPGSGKGTQAQSLVKEHGMVQLSTGELFRDNIRRDTPLGQKAKEYTDKGEYVPDALTVSMVRDWLNHVPAGTRIVFDGFPRTVQQADELDILLREFGRAVDAVIFIDAPKEELHHAVLFDQRLRLRALPRPGWTHKDQIAFGHAPAAGALSFT